MSQSTPQTIISAKIMDYLSKGVVSNKKIVQRMVMLRKRYPNYERYKHFTPAEIQPVINELTRLGYINERRDVTSRVSGLLQGRYGLRKIKEKLQLQGYSSQLIKEVITELEAEVQERSYDSITRLTKQKIANIARKYPDENIHKQKQRALLFVLSKGYDFDEAEQIIKSLNSKL